ncbi:hypothetical protein GCM10010174_89000 [Kutzneria viridogrisea]
MSENNPVSREKREENGFVPDRPEQGPHNAATEDIGKSDWSFPSRETPAAVRFTATVRQVCGAEGERRRQELVTVVNDAVAWVQGGKAVLAAGEEVR